MSLGTEKFIEEVHARPAIWDADSPDYADRILKARSWDEVCAATHPGYEAESKTEKVEIANSLRKRWRSLRDSYTRELNAQTVKTRKSTQVRNTKRKKYVYFDCMDFIRPSVEKRVKGVMSIDGETQDYSMNYHDSEDFSNEGEPPVELPIEILNCKIEEDSLEDYEIPQSPQSSITVNSSYSSKRKADEHSQYFETQQDGSKRFEMDTILPDVSTATQILSHDQDLLFMLSVLGDFKNVHESHRLDLKCDIMNAIKKWKNTPPK